MLAKLKNLSIANGHNKKRIGSIENENNTNKTQRYNNFQKKGNQREVSQMLPKNDNDAVTGNIVIRKSSVPCYYNNDVYREDNESNYEKSARDNDEKAHRRNGKIFAKENYYGKNCVAKNRKTSVPCYYYRNIDENVVNGDNNPKKEDDNNVLNITIENNCGDSQSCPNSRKNSHSPTLIRVVVQPKNESRNSGSGTIRKLSASVQQFFNSPNMLMVSQRFAMPQNVTTTTPTTITTSSLATVSITPTCTGYSPPIATF